MNGGAAAADTVLEVRNLAKYYAAGRSLFGRGRGKGQVKAVDDVSFSVARGETFGLVGESGCGKTTIAKLILRIEAPTSGHIFFDGVDVATLSGRALLGYRRSVQAVFQDPYGSLSPRMRVRDIIGEPLEIHTSKTKAEIGDRVGEVLELVGMRPDHARLFPHEFSGGQRQRIAIARALATDARLLVLDEAVSALDVSIRAQIITLLEQLQQDLGVSYLYIGHDLATVSHLSHRVGVMYLGRLCEIGESLTVATEPQHPYTQALFAAALPYHPDEQRSAPPVTGEVPSALNIPSGCRFHPRCPHAFDRCAAEEPAMVQLGATHRASCHLLSRTQDAAPGPANATGADRSQPAPA
ncbi:MAG: ABC transporter ATP-binding protein [Acidimicrobiales bacterium]